MTYRVAKDAPRTGLAVYGMTGLRYYDEALDFAQMVTQEHAERLGVGYRGITEGVGHGPGFALVTNNGTLVTYTVEPEEARV